MDHFAAELAEAEKLFEEFDNSVTELRLNLSLIENSLSSIGHHGISKHDVVNLEAATVKITTYEMPLATFTDKPSTVNLVLASESIVSNISDKVSSLFSFIFKVIGTILGSIGKFFKWIFNKLTGTKSKPAEIIEEIKSIQKIAPAEVLSYLDEPTQRSMIKALNDIRTPITRINDYFNVKDESLPELLVDHVDVINVACKDIAASIKDTSGTKAAVIEANIANSTRTLLKGVHVKEAVTIPDFNNTGALLGEYTATITAYQRNLAKDIESNKELKPKDSAMAIGEMKTFISETFDAVKRVETFQTRTDVEKLYKNLDKMTLEINKLADESEKHLRKDKTGTFFKSDTAKQLKLTQVTIQRSNQIAMIVVQRIAYTLALYMSIVDSKFCADLPKYTKMFLANQKMQKRTAILEISDVLKPQGKKKD